MDRILQDLSPAALTRAIDDNDIAYAWLFGRLPGGELHDEPGLFWVKADIPIVFCNGVFATNMTAETISPTIERVVAYFRKRNLPFRWLVGPDTRPDNIRDILPRYGLHHDEDEPGMALDLHTLNEHIALSPDLSIQPVTNDTLLLDWLHTWGFPVPEDIIQHFFRAYAPLYKETRPTRNRSAVRSRSAV